MYHFDAGEHPPAARSYLWMIAVMENYRERDGAITVPEVLRVDMGGAMVILDI
jgi:seryl-tRNA synthetase